MMKLARDISFVLFLLTTVAAFQAGALQASASEGCTDVIAGFSCSEMGESAGWWCSAQCTAQGHCVSDSPAYTCMLDDTICQCKIPSVN